MIPTMFIQENRKAGPPGRPMDGEGGLLSYRKLRFYTIKNAPRGSHFGGEELCRLRDPPQAENPAEQDSIVVLCGSDRFQQERVGDAWDALPLVVARFGKQRAGGDE